MKMDKNITGVKQDLLDVSYWSFALLAAIGFLLIILLISKQIKSKLSKEFSNWLEGNNDENWAVQFIHLFDAVFGKNFYVPKRLIATILLSLFSIGLTYLTFGYIFNLHETRMFGELDSKDTLFLVLFVTLIPTYFSLFKSRWILSLCSKTQSTISHLLLFLFAIALTILFNFSGLDLSVLVLEETSPSRMETIALFNISAIFFYAAFIPTIFALTFCFATYLIRTLKLDFQNSPFNKIALIGAAFIFLGSLLLPYISHPSQQGEASAFDSYLCEQDQFTCFHLARINPDPSLNKHYMEIACRNDGVNDNEFEHCAIALRFHYSQASGVAKKILERSCDGGFIRMCNSLGYFHANGIDGAELDLKKALSLYAKACDEREMSGCSSLGYAYGKGLGVEQDHEKELQLYQKACDGNLMNGCFNLGFKYDVGAGVDQDKDKAIQHYQRACDGNYASACYNLGRMYEDGDGAEQDFKKTAAYYEKACKNRHAIGCNNLGVMLETGEGIPQDYIKAANSYDKACERGFATACNNLGIMYEVGQGVNFSYVWAARYYEKACDFEHLDACNNLGLLFEEGYGVKRDYDRAYSLYQMVCFSENQFGCTNLGNMYRKARGVKQDYKKALKLYEEACESTVWSACTNLGLMYDEGFGVKHNVVKAEALYQLACDEGRMRACTNIGVIYDEGKGIEPDHKKALAYYRQACEGGISDACDWAKELENK